MACIESKVPEEIIREIMKPCLAVDLADFCAFPRFARGAGSPARYRHPQPKPISHILLVSKRWLRIGTPLLYESLKLSTISEVRHFAALVRSNTYLGGMVKHLRLEGGYGRELHALIKTMTNIQTLYLFTTVLSKELNTGLIRALPEMNPKVVFLHRDRAKDNVKSRKIMEVLGTALPNWTNLERVVLNDDWALNAQQAESFGKLPNLKEVSMSTWDAIVALDDAVLPQLANNPTLTTIRCRGWALDFKDDLSAQASPALAKLLVNEKTDTEPSRFSHLDDLVVAGLFAYAFGPLPPLAMAGLHDDDSSDDEDDDYGGYGGYGEYGGNPNEWLSDEDDGSEDDEEDW